MRKNRWEYDNVRGRGTGDFETVGDNVLEEGRSR